MMFIHLFFIFWCVSGKDFKCKKKQQQKHNRHRRHCFQHLGIMTKKNKNRIDSSKQVREHDIRKTEVLTKT